MPEELQKQRKSRRGSSRERRVRVPVHPNERRACARNVLDGPDVLRRRIKIVAEISEWFATH